jgi:O-antigen ligase
MRPLIARTWFLHLLYSLLIGLFAAYLLPMSVVVKFEASAQWSVFMVISLIVISWSLLRQWQGWTWYRTPLDWVILAWIVVVISSVLLNFERFNQMIVWLWFMAAAIATWYLVYDVLANKVVTPSELLDALLIAGVTSLFAAALQAINVFRFQQSLEPLLTGRIYGNLSHPNNLAGILAILTPLLAAKFLRAPHIGLRLILGIYFVLNTAFLFWTGSRNGWISAAVGLLVLILTRVRLSRARIGIALLVVAAVVSAGIAIRHDNSRLLMYDVAIQGFLQRPLIGNGPFSYESLMRQQYPNSLDNVGAFYYQAHDAPLQIAAELGLPGLVILALMLWVVVREFRGHSPEAPDQPARAVAIAGLAAGASHLIFDNMVMNVPGIGVVIIIMLAIVLMPDKSMRPRRLAMVLITGLWAVLLAIAFLSRGDNTIFWATSADPQRRLILDFDSTSRSYARWPEWNQAEVSVDGSTFQWSATSDFGLNMFIPTDVDQIIRFRVLPMTPSYILQSLTLKINGDLIPLDMNIDDHQGVVFSGVIPQSSLAKSTGATRLAFHTDQLIEPYSLELNKERRTLGAAFDWLRIEPIPPILWSVAIRFDGFESQLLLGSGWHDSETNADNVTFRWTSATTFTVDAFMATDRDLYIGMRVLESVAPDVLDSLTLEANGEPVELVRTNDPRGAEIILGGLPKSILMKNPHRLRLVFRTNRVISPQLLGTGDDKRELGLSFANLQIVPKP